MIYNLSSVTLMLFMSSKIMRIAIVNTLGKDSEIITTKIFDSQ